MMAKKARGHGRNISGFPEGDPTEAVLEVVKEGVAKPVDNIIKKVAGSVSPNTWKNHYEWNENFTKMEYMNHTSFLSAAMAAANVPQKLVDKIVPLVDKAVPFYEGVRSITSQDYELASAIQRGMLGSSAYATREDLRGIMNLEGYSMSAQDAAVAAYDVIETTGNVELAVVSGIHASDPKDEPSLEEYLGSLGEFRELTLGQYPSNTPPYDLEFLQAALAQQRMYAEHVAAIGRTQNTPYYNSLMQELMRAGAPQSLLGSVANGSSASAFNTTEVNPSMGAAIMRGIVGSSVINDVRYSALDKLASEHARLEYERTGDVAAAAQSGVDAVRNEKKVNTGQSPLFGLDSVSTIAKWRQRHFRAIATT